MLFRPTKTFCPHMTCGLAMLAAAGCLSTGVAGTPPDFSLTRSGRPAASIVISAAPTQAAVLAAVELRDHVKKISGAELPIVSDSPAVSGPRVLIGESAATQAFGLRNRDFKDQEFLIGVRGNDLVLMGRDGDEPYGLRVNGKPAWTPGQFG